MNHLRATLRLYLTPGLAGLACVLAGLSRAAGGVEESPVDLPPWIVEASSLSVGREPDSAASLIPVERLRDRTLAGFGDALRGAPGVILQESFGGFEPPRLSMRGSGLQSAPSSRGMLLDLDDLPLSLADGSFNTALVDPSLAGKIEIRRGPSAWRDAVGAMGGSLNLLSPDQPGFGLRTQAGSWGALRALATLNARQGALFARGAFSWSSMDGYREQSQQHRSALSAGLQYGGSRISLYAADLDYDVPGPLTLSELSASPRGVSAAVKRDKPHRESSVFRLAASHEKDGSDWHAEGGLSWMRTQDIFRQLQANGEGDSESDDLSFRGRLSLQRPLGGTIHHLQARLSGSQGWRDWDRYLNVSGARGTLFASHELQASSASALIEDSIRIGKTLGLSAGTALLWNRRRADSRVLGSNPAERFTWDDTVALPQVLVTWKASPTWALYISASRAAEAPTFDDLLSVSGSAPNLSVRSRSLALQSSRSIEAGARGSYGALSWDLALFRGVWRNEILRLADANGVARGAVNADRTLHEGLESSLRWRILQSPHRLTLAVSNLLVKARFEADPVFGRGRLAGLPPCQGNAELIFEHTDGVFVALGADWTAGRTPVDHGGRLAYGGSVLGRARFGFRSDRGYRIFCEISNVSDRRWIASPAGVLDLARYPAATSVFLPGVARTFTIGFEWNR